jgi:hypothetical protein
VLCPEHALPPCSLVADANWNCSLRAFVSEQVLSAVNIGVTVFCGVTPCRVVREYQHLELTCLHLQVRSESFTVKLVAVYPSACLRTHSCLLVLWCKGTNPHCVADVSVKDAVVLLPNVMSLSGSILTARVGYPVVDVSLKY